MEGREDVENGRDSRAERTSSPQRREGVVPTRAGPVVVSSSSSSLVGSPSFSSATAPGECSCARCPSNRPELAREAAQRLALPLAALPLWLSSSSSRPLRALGSPSSSRSALECDNQACMSQLEALQITKNAVKLAYPALLALARPSPSSRPPLARLSSPRPWHHRPSPSMRRPRAQPRRAPRARSSRPHSPLQRRPLCARRPARRRRRW